MRELYVIVKEEHVHMVVDSSPVNSEMWREAISVLEEIETIKHKKPYLSIDGFSGELHPNMPPPSPNLEVKVVGAVKGIACTLQLYNLRKRGYRALFYEPGCLDFCMKIIEPGMLPGFETLVPEHCSDTVTMH